MKRLLLLIFLIPTLIMADAVIFSGNDVKALKQNLDLFGVVKVLSGALDPAVSGVAAPQGSTYLSTVHGLHVKTGPLNTDWTKSSLLPVDLTSDVVGTLPVANGGTNSATALTNSKVIESRSGSIQESLVEIDSSGGLTVPTDITLSGTQFNDMEIGNNLAYTQSTGLTGGGVLSIDTNPARFDIAAYSLNFSDYTTTADLPVITEVNCPALDSQAVTNLATADSTYLLANTDCSISQQTTFPTPVQRRAKVFIGRLGHTNRTSITAAVNTPNFIIDPTSQLYDVIDAIGAFNISGNIISPNGANLSINRSSGIIFRRGANYVADDQNPHQVTLSGVTAGAFFKSTRTTTSTSVTVIDPGNYDVAGTVTAIPGVGGTSTNRRVYIFSTGSMAIQYGQVTYANLAGAVAGISNEAFTVNPSLTEGGILIAIISCRKDATLLNNTSQCIISRTSRFDSTGVSVGSSSVATIQSAYDNSVAPQITTTLGSVDLKRGSAADTDSVLRIQNGAGVSKVDIKGNGSTRIEAPVSAYNLARDNNLLVNGSFENVTYSDGWTCSLGSTALETTAKTDGNQANAINSIGAGVRCYQTSTTNAANLKGLLGSAIVKIKTTDSIYKVCGLVDGNAAANERNCITVNPTSADLPFYPARTDFYMGGTSNGIVVYTTTTTSQPTVIDDAFVGVFNGGLSQFSNNYNPTAYTPTISGFGTPSNVQCYQWRNNTKGFIDCRFVAGTPTGVNGTVSLPSGWTIANTPTYTTSFKVGDGVRDAGASAYEKNLIVIGQNGATSVGFSYAGTNTNAPLTLQLGSTLTGAGAVINFQANFDIAGWEANTNAAIAGCVDAAGCTDTFSAKVSTAGLPSGENVDWINGSCTVANPNVCTFKTGIFTVAPNCVATVDAINPAITVRISATSSTSVSLQPMDLSGSYAANISYKVMCQKADTDFKPKTVVVSPLQGYVKVPGAENKNIVRRQARLNCTASSSVTSQGFGSSWLTSVSNISSGLCTIVLPAGVFSANPLCQITENQTTASTTTWKVVENSTTSITVFCSSGGAGCSAGGPINFACDGVAP